MKVKELFLVFLTFSQMLPISYADSELDSLSLEDLMEVKVKVATGTEKPLREAPGIISVITEKEIKDLGARDLMEILQTVPGITFAQDVLGNISIVMRGIWAQEGRILLLIDGLEMNERSYGTLLLSNHYSAEHIKRIEIIRGPGSAIYGGFAELGVINITTKDGADIKGAGASSTYSRTSNDFARWANSFMFGQKKDDLDFSVKGSFNSSNFSDRNYTDENGASASLSDGNSKITGEFLNLRGRYKSLYANYIKDNYLTENIILWGDLENTPGSGVIRKPVPKSYLTDVYQIGFQDNVTDDLNLHLFYQNKVQYPYLQPDTKREIEYTNSWRRKVERKVYGARGLYHLNKNLNVVGGVEISEDLSTSLNRLTYTGDPDVFGHNNSNTAKINNTAVFTQLDFTSEFANFTAGLRHDQPSIANSTMVPRIGVTKVVGPAHMKALYAKAFRAPVIENISLNEDIKPELTTTGEVEFGYQFNRDISWTLNFFSTKVSNAIVYSYDTVLSEENYNNYDYVKTLGMETEVNLKHNIHDIKVNYSTYKVDSLNAIPYETSKDSSALIGAPKHKVFIKDTLALMENFSMTPSLTFLSRTNSYEWNGATFSEARLESQFIANLFANYKDVFFQGLDLGAGVNNILNTNIYYAQPYVKEGDYRAGAYPGQSREYILRVGYSKEF